MTVINLPGLAAPALAAEPVPKVPAGHPRVYIRPSDLALLRTKIGRDEFKPAWAAVQAAAKHAQWGPFCSAFMYLVAGDKTTGRNAIEGGLKILAATDDGRVPTSPMHWAACVYDWCYDLLSASEKQQFIGHFQRLAASHEPFYPARSDSHAVVGHGAEGWLLSGQLPIGVAIYDESPLMYDAAARFFFDKFVPVRNFHYASHAHHQGDSYNARFLHDLFASWLFRRMGAGDVFSRQQQFVPYETIYNLRPDGRQFRRGDTYDESGKAAARRSIQLLTAAYYDDPVLMAMADSPFFLKPTPFERVFELLFRPVAAAQQPIATLPLTKYFGSPIGTLVARTGWSVGPESRDAVVRMHIGERFFGNHQRKDFGNFQIFYRGPLAISSGNYEGSDGGYNSDHWRDYHHQTISHNGLLIFDPAEKMNYHEETAANDGGQRWPARGADHPVDLETLMGKDWEYGRVTAHEFGPNPVTPDYSYLAGDITTAYSSKVQRVTRSMVTWNTKDLQYPCVLIVFDRVVAANPTFKKTWLLHTIEEPVVQNRTVTVEHAGGGKLAVESLLPKAAVLTKVGGPGKEFWVPSTQRNYPSVKAEAEAGNWRVEISPAAPAASDLFLHTLSVMDKGTPLGLPAQTIEASDAIGARVLDRVVLFSKSGTSLKTLNFQVAGGDTLGILVCDLEPGAWTIQREGAARAFTLNAAKEGQCVYFQGASGHYSMRLNP